MAIRGTVLLCAALAAMVVACSAVALPRRFRGALNEGLRARGVRLEEAESDPQPQWFTTQTTDHFNRADGRQWSQKYFVNSSYYQPGGPLFLMLGGEGKVSPAYVTGHFNIGNLAKAFNATQVALEHRFYGDSMPLNDSSPEALRLLSSEQALADAAVFTRWYTQQNAIAGPVIVFGGSYSGSLASWARQKYPAVFQGAYATSGPLNAKVDFHEYFEVFQNSVGPQCAAAIKAGSDAMLAMLGTPAGKQQLQTSFQTCSPIVTQNDAYMLASAVTGSLSGVVQYSNDNVQYQPFNAATMCQMILNGPGATPLANIALVNAAVNNHTGAPCTEVNYTAFVEESQAMSDGRSWTWQTCIEFGWYQAADGLNQPFNNSLLPLSFYDQMCYDLFGGAQGLVPEEPDCAWTNSAYGSTTVRATNTFYPNGNVDPWHALGMYNPFLGQGSAYFLINGTAHCADLYPPRDSDPAPLTAARAMGQNLIANWIANYVSVPFPSTSTA